MANHKQIIPFIRAAEGGLSRSLADSAHVNPCPYPYGGVSGWHTNKGITWSTFKTMANRCGYTPTSSLFFAMPDDIWESIYKKGYWDYYNLDEAKHQALANVVVSWAWGSGVGGAENLLSNFIRSEFGVNDYDITPEEIMKNLNKVPVHYVKPLFYKLCEARKNYFVSLNQSANINGWLSRLEKFKIFNEENSFGSKRKILLVVAVILGILYVAS